MEKITLPIKESSEDRVSPLRPDIRWLGIMLGFCLAIMVLVFGCSYVFSSVVISQINIEKEREWFGTFMREDDMQIFPASILQKHHAESYFGDTPIYIKQDDTENAFASLGANIFVHTGLLENVENVEELLFILGHEQEHINNRDVLVSLSRELPVQITLESLGLNFGNSLVDTNKIMSSFYSREHEYAADQGGIKLLNKLKMNTACAVGFFERVGSDFESYTEFISTHPESKKRLKIIKSASQFPEKECTPFDWNEAQEKLQL